jgi:hypothetical protein
MFDLRLQGGPLPAGPGVRRLLDHCRRAAAQIPGCTATAPAGLSFVWRGISGQVRFSGSGDGVFDRTDILLSGAGPGLARVNLGKAGGARIPGKGGSSPEPSGWRREGTGLWPPLAQASLSRSVPRVLGVVSGPKGIRLEDSPTGVRLSVGRWPAVTGDLDCWLVGAFQVVQALGWAWIDRPAQDPLKSLERVDPGARCLVCGTPFLQGRIVRCGRCRTPHHLECWGFNRRCSVYACGGRDMSGIQNPEAQRAAPFL